MRALDPDEQDLYKSLKKGFGYGASSHDWRGCAKDLAAMRRLVSLGLARLTRPVPWAKQGVYVLGEKDANG